MLCWHRRGASRRRGVDRLGRRRGGRRRRGARRRVTGDDGGRGGGRGSRDQPDEILRERFGEVAGYDEEEQPVTAPIGGERCPGREPSTSSCATLLLDQAPAPARRSGPLDLQGLCRPAMRTEFGSEDGIAGRGPGRSAVDLTVWESSTARRQCP